LDEEEGMIAIARWAHLVTAWLFVAGVLLQGYLAGAALAQLGGSGDFATHVGLGYSLMGLLALAVPVFAIVGRFPRAQVGWSGLVLLLYIVQTVLPVLRSSSPAIAALHPANAMIMLVVGAVVAVAARRHLTATAAA
jgi:uncharacterized protein DUF6220